MRRSLAPDSGLVVRGGEVTLSYGTISAAGNHGVLASAGILIVDGATISGSGGDGVHLEGAVVATVDGATLADNALYALSCDGNGDDAASSDVDLLVCTAEVSGNLAGDFDQFGGCELDTVCEDPTP